MRSEREASDHTGGSATDGNPVSRRGAEPARKDEGPAAKESGNPRW